jgi:low affinity Fe/Cu permease
MTAASKSSKLFTGFATAIAHAAGRPIAFIACCAIVIGWAVSGPIFGFSDTWQLVINTGTTIVTFLMVFLIQNTQNRDGIAIQAKLDELIRASAAHNAFIGIEHLTDSELNEILAEIETRAKEEGRELDQHERAQVAARFARTRAARRSSKRLEARP